MMTDTIAGISTPLGEGGIGIIRISGKGALAVAEKITRLKSILSFRMLASHTINYGFVVNPQTDEKIDEILLLFMKGPRSFTAEDVVEIHCHGGPVPVRAIYELAVNYGARPAEPGEFTKRAFLNGRIDLAQAEAVIDIIRAKTDAGSRAAMHQLQGLLSEKISEMRHVLLETIAFAEATIDFPEEDIEEITAVQIAQNIEGIIQQLKCLLDTSRSGKIIREGLYTVIAGKPNVGKSSLLNALLRENRAIVTDVPGTTRDIIEEYINIKGIPLKIVDTAGVRETNDIVEKLGVERAQALLGRADLLLIVLDASLPLNEEDRRLLMTLHERPAIIILNKTDLPFLINQKEIEALVPDKKVLRISLEKNEGITELEEYIASMVYEGSVSGHEGAIVTNVRHQYALKRAYESLSDVLQTVDNRMPLDCMVVDLRAAWEALGEITGETIGEDIVEQIFATFCIGK
jgi:tRNA modification GTPase